MNSLSSNLICPCLDILTALFNRSSSSSSEVSELPTSVILEILLKLPIKSIIRCKSVCKSWYKLISDPYFTTTYSLNPPFTAVIRSDHRTIINPLDDVSFCFVEIGSTGEVLRTPFNPYALAIPSTGIIGIMGSCNGLLCLVLSPQLEYETHGNYVSNRDSIYNNQSVYVVNPLSGELILLPHVKNAEDISDVVYGFGSSKSGNKYKILRIVMKRDIKVASEILTIGVDNVWRCFEDSCMPCCLFPCGITINGVIHWIADNRRSGVIYAFDIDEERGHCISLPPRLLDSPGNIVLSIWNDNLCLTDNSSEYQVDIWTMKQYGVVESWSRDIILKRWVPSSLRPYPLNPITTLRNGDLLLSRPYGQSLICFDPTVNKCSKLEVSDVDGVVSFLFGYTPCFFSLENVFRVQHESGVI